MLTVTPGPSQASSEEEGKSRSISRPVLRRCVWGRGGTAAFLVQTETFTPSPASLVAPVTALVLSCHPFPSALPRPSWTSAVSSPFHFSLCCQPVTQSPGLPLLTFWREGIWLPQPVFGFRCSLYGVQVSWMHWFWVMWTFRANP